MPLARKNRSPLICCFCRSYYVPYVCPYTIGQNLLYATHTCCIRRMLDRRCVLYASLSAISRRCMFNPPVQDWLQTSLYVHLWLNCRRVVKGWVPVSSESTAISAYLHYLSYSSSSQVTCLVFNLCWERFTAVPSHYTSPGGMSPCWGISTGEWSKEIFDVKLANEIARQQLH